VKCETEDGTSKEPHFFLEGLSECDIWESGKPAWKLQTRGMGVIKQEREGK
jgi:hypothetical protein